MGYRRRQGLQGFPWEIEDLKVFAYLLYPQPYGGYIKYMEYMEGILSSTFRL